MIATVPHFLVWPRALEASQNMNRSQLQPLTEPDTMVPSSFATVRKAMALRTGANLQDHAHGLVLLAQCSFHASCWALNPWRRPIGHKNGMMSLRATTRGQRAAAAIRLLLLGLCSLSDLTIPSLAPKHADCQLLRHTPCQATSSSD